MGELRVVEAGPLTLVEDLGRVGLAHLGVPRSGALDQPALAIGNRLVDNPASAAGLEILLGGVVLEASGSTVIAVTGAAVSVYVGDRPVPTGTAVPVPTGARIRIDPANRGMRAYLAVAGGIAVDAVLGSRSTDLLTGLGPAPLRSGALLPVGEASGSPDWTSASVESTAPRSLGFAVGPRDDWFATEAVETICGAAYTVETESNRIGLRLRGPVLRRRRSGELPSEGMVLGAIQVRPDGQPMVFLADHPVTGGYPVIGVVSRADLSGCAQLRPGEQVRFRRLGRPEAVRGSVGR